MVTITTITIIIIPSESGYDKFHLLTLINAKQPTMKKQKDVINNDVDIPIHQQFILYSKALDLIFFVIGFFNEYLCVEDNEVDIEWMK